MTMRPTLPGFVLAIAGLVLCPSLRAAGAANGLANPDFDAGITAWSATAGALAFDSGLDVDACAGSGSAAASMPVFESGNWTLTVVSDGSCVPVTPGSTLALRARVLPALAAAHTDFAVLGYSDANCAIGEAERPIAGFGPLPLLWIDFKLGLTLDGATHSVRFLMRMYDPVVSDFAFALDRTYLGEGLPVFLDGFGAESACRWSVAQP